MDSETWEKQLDAYRQQVEEEIDRWTPEASEEPTTLHSAMRHSLEAGGKRLRPVLVCACADSVNEGVNPLPAAAAVECLHTYTLIHDDLPSMDDSDLRRGHPTCHKVYGDAAAVLAGDALLTQAFEMIGRGYDKRPEIAAKVSAELARAAGSRQLVGGQMEDIENEGEDISADTLAAINAKKTGALIAACCVIGGIVGEADSSTIDSLQAFGFALGGAFQVVDDILDFTSSDEDLGKTSGRDEANGKTTFVTLEGLEAARARAQRLTEEALTHLTGIQGNTDFLQTLTKRLLARVS